MKANIRTRTRFAALAACLLAMGAPARAADDLDWNDTRDLDFAGRGFVATRTDPKIVDAAGHVVFDLSAHDFLKGPPPTSVDPSLWRQSALLARHGLFKVTDGVWQVRGFDLANATFIAGRSGWIVVDCLTSKETARAALDLVNQTLGTRKVVAIIYTHSHVDHFGGARGLVDDADLASGAVQVIAPAHFIDEAASENVIAGNAMLRRAAYQFGTPLPPGPLGQVSSGIGPTLSTGTQTLIPPTVTIDHTGQTLTVDGVAIEFQITPGTEAPAEMNLWLPAQKVLDLAENANATQHNVLTPRGALVRDALVWSEYLTQSLARYGDKADVLITSHAWPRFGRDTLVDFIIKHRDAYRFLHDQTVRLMNEGLTGPEIADRLTLPPVLAREWYNRPYYGSISFNSRAVYQRYMGWYDANPAHLNPFPPAEESRRYVAAMGGADKVLALMKAAEATRDDRWATELGSRLVMADATNGAARAELASTYTRLGQGQENALWRNMYLTAADELTHGIRPDTIRTQSLDLVRAMPTDTLLNLLAVRFNADKAGTGHALIDVTLTDRNEHVRLNARNGVLTPSHDPLPGDGKPDLTLTMTRQDLLLLAFTPMKLTDRLKSGGIKAEGDPAAFERLISWFDTFKPDFPIVWR